MLKKTLRTFLGASMDVDVVGRTGFYTPKEGIRTYVAGAKKVVISARAGNDLPTIVYNVNYKILKAPIPLFRSFPHDELPGSDDEALNDLARSRAASWLRSMHTPATRQMTWTARSVARPPSFPRVACNISV